MTRGSRIMPTNAANSVSNIATPTNVSGGLNAQARRSDSRGPGKGVLEPGETPILITYSLPPG